MNKSLRCTEVLAVLLLIVTIIFTGQAKAQAAKKAEKVAVKISKFTGLGQRSLVETPNYHSNIGSTVRRPKKWAEIKVVYNFESAPEWVDDLTVEYHVLTAKTIGRTKKYSYYRKVVRTTDIERGSSKAQEHMSAVYLHPAAVERYGDPVAVGVEISHNGKVLAAEHDVGNDTNLKKAMTAAKSYIWWKISAITGNVEQRTGYLLDRSESPFAFINIDNFERIK